MRLIRGLWKEIEDFGAPASAGGSQQPGWQHPASVQDEEVPLSQFFWNRRKGAMGQRARSAIENKQAGGVPARQRSLRDEGWGEGKIELLGLQNSFFCGRSGSGRSRPKCL